jgi:hypothetical protein
VCAVRGQRPGGSFACVAQLARRRQPPRVLAEHDVERPQVDPGRVTERRLVRVRVLPVRAGDRAQDRHEVLGAARQRPHREQLHGFAVGGRELAGVRDQAVRRHVAEHAVEERRDPDRAGDV